MAKKTYEAPTTQSWLMSDLALRGKRVNIKFDDGRAKSSKTPAINCKFTTSDVDLQNSIEATKQFRFKQLKLVKTVGEILSQGIEDVSSDKEKPIVMEPEVIDKPTVTVEPPKEVDSKLPEAKELKYKGWQQVATWLENYRGLDIKLLNTPAEIKAACKEQNITLLNLK